MSEKLGVLLVTGSRTHQENYAPKFAEDPRCRLVGLTDEADVSPDRDRWNRELADALGVPFFDSLEKALERSDVHIVSVCSEPERRGRVGTLCCARREARLHGQAGRWQSGARARSFRSGESTRRAEPDVQHGPLRLGASSESGAGGREPR